MAPRIGKGSSESQHVWSNSTLSLRYRSTLRRMQEGLHIYCYYYEGQYANEGKVFDVFSKMHSCIMDFQVCG